MKKAAIFDMDGLMFDSQKLYDAAWIDVAREFGREPSQAFIDEIRGTNGPFAHALMEKYYPGIDHVKFFAREVEMVTEIEKTYLPKKPGLDEILAFMKAAGMHISVASSSEAEMVHHNIEFAGVDQYFDAVICGDEVTRAKPDPEVFLKAAAGMGCDPKDCYVLEDSFAGIIAAHSAGCSPIMVPDAVQPTDEIRNLCVGVYASLHEVREAMERGEI